MAPRSTNGGILYTDNPAHQLPADVDRRWLLDQINCLLISRPTAILAALAYSGGTVRPEHTGLPQQVDIFHRVVEQTGEAPLVIDTADLLQDPERTLRRWCDRLRVDFVPQMLVGVANGISERVAAERSELPAELRSVWAVCQPLYDQLYAERL